MPLEKCECNPEMDCKRESHDPWLVRKEAADYIGTTPGTLSVWDSLKR
jgi:hypothetical protein